MVAVQMKETVMRPQEHAYVILDLKEVNVKVHGITKISVKCLGSKYFHLLLDRYFMPW